MNKNAIGERGVTVEEQSAFSKLTGDVNPMHTDKVLARRTQAGFPVVHGAHTLLWLMNQVALTFPNLGTPVSMKVKFNRMVYIGEPLKAYIRGTAPNKIQASVETAGGNAIQLLLNLGDSFYACAPVPGGDVTAVYPSSPLDRRIEEMEGLSGLVPFHSPSENYAAVFPDACSAFGAQRLGAIATCSFVVGMIVPGLHSIFAGLNLRFCETALNSESIYFRTKSVDKRFGLVRIEVSGSGVSADLETFVRPQPTNQHTCLQVAERVGENEFSQCTVLVVGGSRGLGELAAKIICMGGGNALVTYHVGRDEADSLSAVINDFGRGKCSSLKYDISIDAKSQLEQIKTPPTHIYYFATPPIFAGASAKFSVARLNEFTRFYVDGFADLVDASRTLWNCKIGYFYPSSVAVIDRPQGMTEYAMAKSAAEVYCADVNSFDQNARVVIERLPRLLTDQTATIQNVETADSLETMLPIVRKVQRS